MSGPYDPETYPDFAAGWIPEDANEVKYRHLRLFVELTTKRILNMPESWSAYAGQIVVAKSDGTTPTAASQVGGTTVSFGDKTPARFRADGPTLTATTALTHALHGGQVCYCKNTSPITLTLGLTADPLTGLQSRSVVEILRCVESTAEVTLSFSGFTNRNPDLHTRIKPNRSILVRIDGANVYILGYSKA